MNRFISFFEAEFSALIALQIIRMNNERFAIPEILFHPSDVGIHEMGIAEAIIHSINGTPTGAA